MQLRAWVIVCLIATSACSSGGDDGASGAGGNAGTAGTSGSAGMGGGNAGQAGTGSGVVGTVSGDPLFVQLQLSVQQLEPPSSHATVGVVDTLTGEQVLGATVTLTPQGSSPIDLPGSTGNVYYQKSFALGPFASYELSATHSAGSRTGIPVVAPSAFSVSVAPPPKVGTASTVSWTHSEGDGVGVHIQAGDYGTLSASPLPDTGSFVLPSEAFDTFGGKTVTIIVERVRTVFVPDQVQLQTVVRGFTPTLSVEP